MKKRYKKKDELLPVDKPELNRLYHVSWGYSRGIVGKVISIDENAQTVEMITPKTKKLFKYPVKWSELRHTRRTQSKIESNIIISADGRDIAVGDEAWTLNNGKPERSIVDRSKKFYADYTNCLMSIV